MQRVNVHHVAARAGVSIKTVSRVINDEPNVRPTTREAVLNAINELGYRPDTSARRLAGRRSFRIALLYEDPGPYTSPSASYVTELQGGVLARTQTQGYELLIHPFEGTSGVAAETVSRLINENRLDGCIIAPPFSDLQGLTAALDDERMPSVRISPGVRTRADESVRTNDRELCAEMTNYLASLGHERIGFLIGHPDHRAVQNRYVGFREALEALSLPLHKHLVEQGDNSFESGQRAARRLLSGAHARPTAIIASNDDMAAGVLYVAHELGLNVPRDLSVAGFDDAPLARHLWPTLTTIRQPIFELAGAAADLLFARLRGHDTKRLPRTILGELKIRDSTGPAPADGGAARADSTQRRPAKV
ncbi:MAG: LacI family DNA-binding transcriptional regulator [Pseudomonadota bacterium]